MKHQTVVSDILFKLLFLLHSNSSNSFNLEVKDEMENRDIDYRYPAYDRAKP